MTNQNSTHEGENALTETTRKPPSMEMLWNDDGTLNAELSGDFERIKSAISNSDVSSGLVVQIAALGSYGNRVDERAANFTLGFVDAMRPKNAADALLLTQMAATHQAMMMMARRLNHVENIPQQDSAERALNKLGRTFAAQMVALRQYRSKGQQTIRVERVTVQDGGQAIVGSVETGGRDREEK
ncbi:hypothetical protein [Sedimentitalea nanhaiensis]|uniref:Uncharacterized protein n=1 Tax=Sedimentitalea nanhaiensis TaxID=999627 RepID=A0A1I7CKQ2_9RHOB|nr:hypothetical protein [Sedimentitalea nanhaiensis]SFU00006.1 hypothetical protein SAMN05216236_11773 [Sedimentitalea nanhaiensis]